MHPAMFPKQRTQPTTPGRRSHWAIPSPLLLIIGFFTFAYGTAHACSPSPDTTVLPALNLRYSADPGNPRIADLLAAESTLNGSSPLSIPARIHGSSVQGFRDLTVLAVRAHGWHQVQPRHGSSPTNTLIVPQADLHLLTPIANDPEATITALAAAPTVARSTPAGPPRNQPLLDALNRVIYPADHGSTHLRRVLSDPAAARTLRPATGPQRLRPEELNTCSPPNIR